MHFQFFIYSSLHERQENCTILTWQNPPSDKIQNRSIVGSIFSFTNLFLFFSFFFSFHHFYIPQNSKMLQNMKAQYQKVIEFELWTLSSRCGYSACQKAFFFSLLACIIKINGSLCCTGSLHGYISSPPLFTRAILYKRQQLRMLNCSPSATCSAHLSREEKLTLSTFLQP